MKPTATPPEIATHPTETIATQIRRRRLAARNLPPLRCGHRDPLDCRDDCGKYWRAA
ncbi:hypothetical protein [Streptomyces lavendulae]|uniref:hypothetical protein n=1 Tax=Streptomyces lavendulae TaxID=1914 RepID=UPI0033CDBE06